MDGNYPGGGIKPKKGEGGTGGYANPGVVSEEVHVSDVAVEVAGKGFEGDDAAGVEHHIFGRADHFDHGGQVAGGEHPGGGEGTFGKEVGPETGEFGPCAGSGVGAVVLKVAALVEEAIGARDETVGPGIRPPCHPGGGDGSELGIPVEIGMAVDLFFDHPFGGEA